MSNPVSRLQSVLNAAAQPVFSTRKHESVSSLLQQRTDFKLAVLMYRCLHSTVPPYLADELCRVADVDSRRRLRSMSTLIVPPMRPSTIGDRAFPAAASRVWNSLPSGVTSSTSLTVFRRCLKTELFLSPMFWLGLCRLTILLSLFCNMLDSERVLSVVKCSCSRRIL